MGRLKLSLTLLSFFISAAIIPALSQTQTIDEFLQTFAEEWVRLDPDLATITQYFTGEEQDRLEQQFTAFYNPESWRTRRGVAKRGLNHLRRFDREALTDEQRVSVGIVEWHLQRVIERESFDDYYNFPLNQFSGINVGLVRFLSVHPLRTTKDGSNYVARLRQVGPRVGEAIQNARQRAAKGLIPPRFIVDATVRQMRRFVETPPGQNLLVTTLRERGTAVKQWDAASRNARVAEAEEIVARDIYPRWREGIAFLESLLPNATDDAGLSRFKGGAAAYAHFLKDYTTTDLTADQVHQIGLREVARIEKEMDSRLRQLGRTEGSLNARIAQLKKDLSYPLNENGRQIIMADLEQIIEDAQRRAALQFDKRPKADVVAQPSPAFNEANVAPNYFPPAPDGSRPGLFQMPLRPEWMTKFALRSVVYHEAVPGHHFQLALAQEDASVPKFRRLRAFGSFPAYAEGWGLYAERLAAESGWYGGDPEGLLGQLDLELLRARRLVVDTGLHTKGWTRQQAIDYGIEASEVERYVATPGQACAYMIGQLKILELRDKARSALKDRFSEKGFHNVVLGVGLVPLTILEEEVDR